MTDDDAAHDAALAELHVVIAPYLAPALADAEEALSRTGLSGSEQREFASALADAVRDDVLDRMMRVLLLELHAVRETGGLTAADPAGRWAEWLAMATAPTFVQRLADRYPTLPGRIVTLVDQQIAATTKLADRFVTDRGALTTLLPDGADPALTRLSLGAGDSHLGGQTVAVLRLAGGAVVYKPRDLGADRALHDFLQDLLADEPETTRIRVPAVVERDGYGWAEFVAHRHAADDAELATFYRGIGHWLAVSRLLGATDLHAENVIAAGPVPVVVDCETLLTPAYPAAATPWGQAHDRATRLLRESVLRTGLLPGRAAYLGLRGADLSAVGALPGEQPEATGVGVVDLGTDTARLSRMAVPDRALANLPAAVPPLVDHWPSVIAAFTDLTDRLTALDRSGELAPMLARFGDVPVRTVLRDTLVYGEIGSMLWHPAALHDESAARARAEDLLARHAANTPGAPTDPAVIAGEVADLLAGDVPLFSVHPARLGLLDATIKRWRDLDPRIDRDVIECAVQSAYQDEETGSGRGALRPERIELDHLDARRRILAAEIIADTARNAIHGADGTVTWISMTLGPVGLAMLPLGADLYGGLPGVTVGLAAYTAEVAAGRADPVEGADDLFAAALETMAVREDAITAERARNPDARPEPPGAYVGLASRIWAWLLLGDLGAVPAAEALHRATALADVMAPALAADGFHDLLLGRAGTLVPLLRLGDRSGCDRYRSAAVEIGDDLIARATRDGDALRWPGVRSDAGIGGFSHGTAGIGWALVRLGRHTGLDRFVDAGMAGIRFQDRLRVPDGWTDLRKADETAENWCHGCDGVGVLAADLAEQDDDPNWTDRLGHAARSTWRGGFGDTHTLCHGDMGSWEVIDLAIRAGVAPTGVTRTRVDARVLSSIEAYRPRAAMTNALFRPGLLAGMGGMAWQLLRMHPDCALPSLLVPDPR